MKLVGLPEATSAIFCHFRENVDNIRKILKTKTFILEKFLDTAFRTLLRFLPESFDGFFEHPLELFSLEKKRPSKLPDGLFVCFCRCAPTR
jgi:hypothetical protein